MKHKKKSKRSWKNDKDSSSSSQSDSASDLDGDTELDLADYAGDCIKLMSEVFKVLGDKKLKKMTPTVLKPITLDDLKACLVEESMALSKKRIISIINGELYSSSSETEDDLPKMTSIKKEIDVISLESISDDSDIICFDDERLPEPELMKKNNKKRQHTDVAKNSVTRKKHKKRIKTETVNDSEKRKLKKKNDVIEPAIEEKAMTALELLELQARARAIKSQLMLETAKSSADEDVVLIKKEEDTEISSEIEKNNQEKINFGASTSSIQDSAENLKPKKVKLRRDHLLSNANIIRTSQSNTNVFEIEPNETVEENKITNSENANVEENICMLDKNSPRRRGSTDSLIIESPSHPLIVLSSDDEGNVLGKKHSKKSSSKGHSSQNKNKPSVNNTVEHNHVQKEKNELIKDQSNSETENNNTDKNTTTLEEGEIEDNQELQTEPCNEISLNNVVSEEKNTENVPIESHIEKPLCESKVPDEEIHIVIADSNSKTTDEISNLVENNPEKNQNLNETADLDCIIIDSEPDFESEPETLNEPVQENSTQNENSCTEIDNLTWKSRWLGSKRVQNVLQTSKIYNSMKRKLTSRKEKSSVAKLKSTNEKTTPKVDEKKVPESSEDNREIDSSVT